MKIEFYFKQLNILKESSDEVAQSDDMFLKAD